MTRTSATGKARPAGSAIAQRVESCCLSAGSRYVLGGSDRIASVRAEKCRAGFTLVELLMTVTIIGLAAGAVVLAMPDPRPTVGAEAERFAARLVRAREEAILSNRPVAVDASASGYAFSTFDGDRWTPLTDGPFDVEAWETGTTVSPPGDPVRVVFDPTGVTEPAILTLGRDRQTRSVSIDGAGEVKLDG